MMCSIPNYPTHNIVGLTIIDDLVHMRKYTSISSKVHLILNGK